MEQDLPCPRGLHGFSLAGAMADSSCELRIDIRFWTDFCTHHEIHCSTFRGHRDSIIRRLVKSYANKEKYKISTEITINGLNKHPETSSNKSFLVFYMPLPRKSLLIKSWDSNEPFLGASNVISRPVKSQVQVSKTNQWKSCYVENICLEHKPNTSVNSSSAHPPTPPPSPG